MSCGFGLLITDAQVLVNRGRVREAVAVETELLVGRGAYILAYGLWAQAKQLCESSAKDVVKLAQRADARGVEAQAWIVLYEHLLRAHPTATAEQLKECSAALAKAISLGLQPATQRSRSVQLAQIHLQLAASNLPLAERIQFAVQGLKTIDQGAVAGASPQQFRMIEKLRTDLEKLLGELRQKAPQPAAGAEQPVKPAASGK